MGNAQSFFPTAIDKEQLERGTVLSPRFNEDGLIAAITTDATSGKVLMFAWMNAEALKLSIETGEVHYWSRSRQELWHKGATSGQIQKIREIRTDCDQDAILLKVEQLGGGACHVGHESCFYRIIESTDQEGGNVLRFEEES